MTTSYGQRVSTYNAGGDLFTYKSNIYPRIDYEDLIKILTNFLSLKDVDHICDDKASCHDTECYPAIFQYIMESDFVDKDFIRGFRFCGRQNYVATYRSNRFLSGIYSNDTEYLIEKFPLERDPSNRPVTRSQTTCHRVFNELLLINPDLVFTSYCVDKKVTITYKTPDKDYHKVSYIPFEVSWN